ncbi:Hypothetical predicted protein [Xyrichtys novacula]|uniref:Uncharacterized protein n=1 Tax=Xyrichtys novacula TaxID=13765 RepID=A0AAV1G0G3_XYRNO|nr:Hypothetical predicted protein [Xyrichtys novacula]
MASEERGWDPSGWTAAAVVNKKRGGKKGGCISHGGFECKQFLLGMQARPAILLLCSSGSTEHSTHLLNKIECQSRSSQRLRAAALQGGNMDFVAAMY